MNKDLFLKDVRNHRLTVIRDKGMYRHLRFGIPGSSTMRFDILTWPGYLCYTGDMGTFVFRRLDDMLQFFRSPHDQPLSTSPDYWAEKLEAVDTCGGLKSFDRRVFDETVQSWIDDFCDGEGLLAKDKLDLVREVGDRLRYCESDDERGLQEALDGLSCNGNEVFESFYGTDCRSYSPRYLWCCLALPWAIKVYDDYKDSPEAQ